MGLRGRGGRLRVGGCRCGVPMWPWGRVRTRRRRRVMLRTRRLGLPWARRLGLPWARRLGLPWARCLGLPWARRLGLLWAPQRLQGRRVGDPVGGEMVRVLEPLDCLRRQRAIATIRRARREAGPRQSPLEGTDQPGPSALEVSGAAHQRAASQRLAGLRTDDPVGRQTVGVLERRHGFHCQRAVAPIDWAR
jgi:hypothetical protein